MDKKGVSKDHIHLMGLSLGAHLCGYIGKQIPGIRRITGNTSAIKFLTDYFKNVQFRPTQGRRVL